MRRLSCILVSAALLAATACGDDSSGDPDGGPDDGDGGAPSADAAPVSPVTQCDAEIPVATDGVCDATAGTGNAILIRGDVLAPDTVYEDGAVLVNGTDIVCVGCDCGSAPGAADATVIDCGGASISPGLINPHDHMNFSEGSPIDHGATRYDHRHDWRGSLSTPANDHGTGYTSTGMRWVELRAAVAGTTTMVGSGRANGMVRNADRLEDADVTLGFAESEFATFSLGDSNEQFRSNCGWDYRYSEQESSSFPALLPHVAEGIDNYAAEEFRCQSTSFDGGRDFTERNSAHIHSIGLQAPDYLRMARDDTKLIWSVRSNISLYGMTADVTTFARLGGIIALGTDWTYSGSANIVRELKCADDFNRWYLDGHFTDEQLWKMVTINAARTIASGTLIGSLEAGKLADIAVFGGDGNHYRAIIDADSGDVGLVLKAGAPLYGDADVVSTLGHSCEAVTVCGQARAVCAAREFDGTTYSQIESDTDDGGDSYPLFFCDTPASEPSCVPSRPNEFDGTLGGSDADGDGIDDGDDNCPNVFNPIRPIDGGNQPDADNDGTGDHCDPTPVGDDIDGDTVANDIDNCPFDANTTQIDMDSDHKGDVCDFCPGDSNPDTTCPVPGTSIVDIQNGTVSEGTLVRIQDVVVTGQYFLGFSVQDPNAPSAAYSGVFVFSGNDEGVAIGDIVTLEGEVQEYFMLTEIVNPNVQITGNGGVINPTSLTVAEAAQEQYEGVLVRLTDATVSDANHDCSADNSSCNDSNLWEVNGPTGIVAWDLLYEDGDWASHIGDVPFTGVMHYRFDRRRIMPRVTGDF